jgi:hypothetical protein
MDRVPVALFLALGIFWGSFKFPLRLVKKKYGKSRLEHDAYGCMLVEGQIHMSNHKRKNR